jgi:DNA-binding transcriptional MocR family regulator
MPGEAFYPAAADGYGRLRLNFSHATTAQAESGLAKLSQLIRGFA